MEFYIAVAVFISGIVVGNLCKAKKAKEPEPDYEARNAIECAALSAYTGTAVSRIKKEKLGEIYRVTAYFSFELEPGTIRETYAVVEDATVCSFEFTAKLIASINLAKGA